MASSDGYAYVSNVLRARRRRRARARVPAEGAGIDGHFIGEGAEELPNDAGGRSTGRCVMCVGASAECHA